MLPGREAAFTAACLLLALAASPGAGGSPSPEQGPLPSAASAGTTSSPTPTVTRREASTGNARAPPENVVVIHVGDYDYDEEDEGDGEASTESTAGVTTRLCDYDRCRHGQEPCAELQRRAAPSDPCLCPGVADEGTQPDPPELLRPVSVSDESVRLHWCEPLSTVLGYRLLLSDGGGGGGGVRAIDGAQLARGPPGGQTQAGRPPTLTSQPLPPDTRLHTLSGLRSGTTYLVCVAAFNAAGVSSGLEGMAEEARPRAAAAAAESGACRRFTTKPSRYMLAAIGSSALLVLLVLAVASGAGCLVARRRRRRRQLLEGKQREAEGEGMAVTSTGASNPVYQGPAAVTPELGPINDDV